MPNANLHAAKRNKNDEFYTRREDIEAGASGPTTGFVTIEKELAF